LAKLDSGACNLNELPESDSNCCIAKLVREMTSASLLVAMDVERKGEMFNGDVPLYFDWVYNQGKQEP
jgi:hypothetical protein